MKHESLSGMDLFDHNGTGILELQRDDEAALFTDDDDAWAYFVHRLELAQERAGHDNDCAIEMAISLLNNWRPYMAAVMRGEDPHG